MDRANILTADTSDKMPGYKQSPGASMTTLIFACSSAYINALSFGYMIGYTSPALPDMVAVGILNRDQASWFGSIATVAAIAGGAIAGWVVEKYGRLKSLQLTAAPYLVGWLLITFFRDLSMLYIGRALTGVACGMTVVCSPLYVAEMSPKELRGMLGSGVQLFITIGILLVNVFGMYTSYATNAGLCALASVGAVVMATMIPESPRWLLLRNRRSDALKSLMWIRGPHADVEDECRDIEESLDPDDRVAWRDFTKSELFNPLKVSLGLMIFQQLSGINVVMFYTAGIFKEAGLNNSEKMAASGVGVVQVIATLVACILMDRSGRRSLLLLGGSGMALSLFIFGCHYRFAAAGAWLPVACVMFYTLFFALGWGPIPMLVMSEIFPVRARGTASALASMTNWVVAFIVTKEFDLLQNTIGAAATFWLFGLFCVLGVVFVWKKVPETKGKSLEDIELYFLGRAVRGI